MSSTIMPIAHTLVPQERWNQNEIVYYNPVVKQKLNDDGPIQFRVRGTAGGNLLTVPYDVSARTASLDTVKLLIHSVISGAYSWMTIDIADFYLGTPPTRLALRISSHSHRQDTCRNHGQVQPNPPTLQPARLLRNTQVHVRPATSRKAKPNSPHQAPQHTRIRPMRQHPVPFPPPNA